MVTGGVAYFGDRDGGVHAVDLLTGEPRWHRHGTTAHDAVLGRPVVLDELVIAGVGGSLSAHDRGTGAVRWSVRDAGGYPTVAGDLVLAVDVRVAAWDLASRQRRWRGPRITGLLAAPPVPVGGLLVLAQTFEPNHVHGGLHALDPRTGRVAWSVEADTHGCCLGDACDDQLIPSPFPVAADGDLVWTTRRHEHSMGVLAYDVIALDARTGQERVAYAASWLGAGDDVSGAVAVAGGTLYCPAGDRLDAVEAVTGSPRWTFRAAAAIVGSAVPSGGLVQVATADGRLHGLDAGTGTTRWSVPVGEVTGWVRALEGAAYELVPTPFTEADGALYVVTDAGVLALSVS